VDLVRYGALRFPEASIFPDVKAQGHPQALLHHRSQE
jgi:hypothetical protein